MTLPIGVTASRVPGVQSVVAMIQDAERTGIPAVWMTTGGGEDAMSVFVAAALKTAKIKMGTAVVQTYPRHPLVLAREAHAIGQLAPGRFRLGVGPSHRPLVEAMGIPFTSPLANLREYVLVLKAYLHTGKVDFKGAQYKAQGAASGTVDVPVMVGALQRGSFDLAGEISDGAITWLCPAPYIRDVALPAMKAAAAKAGRPTPPLIAHLAVCVHDDAAEAREAVREQIMNIRLPFYQRMLRDAGFPEAMEGKWSDRLIDAAVACGNEQRVAARIKEQLAIGAAEVLVSPIPAGKDRKASLDRVLRCMADVAGKP